MINNRRLNPIPPGWAMTTLNEVATWGSGGTPSRKNPNYYDGAIPWIKTGELGPKYIRKTEEHISDEAIQRSSAKVFKAGSIGIAMYGATIGKLSIFGIDASTNQACAVAQPLTEILDTELLYYFLLSEKRNFIEAGKGGAQPNISQGVLKSWRFALPPVNEQQRIVAKIEALLSELDKGVESLETAREQLKVYRQAVLKQAFEGHLTAQWRKENEDKLELPEQLLKHIQKERDARYEQQPVDREDAINAPESNENEFKQPRKPKKSECADTRNTCLVEIPKQWTCAPIKDLNSDVFDGPFGSHLKTNDYVSEGVRVIRLENIGHLVFVDSKQSFVTFEKYETIKKHTVYQGDVIVASFVTDSIRAAIVPETVDRAINKADCFCLRLHGESVRNDFVAAFLSTRSAYKTIESGIHGVGRPRINTAQLKNFTIPVCSREEQDLIMQLLSEKLSLIENLDSLIDCEIQRCEALRQSILKKAFYGQLVPQDPEDEPASALLERILIEKDARSKTNKDSEQHQPRCKRVALT